MVGDEDDGEWGLEISPVESSDDGVYQCQVSSQADDPAIRSGEARLSVMSPPGPPLILQGAELMISQGEELELTCVSRGGRPAGEVTQHIMPHQTVMGWSESKQVKPDFVNIQFNS